MLASHKLNTRSNSQKYCIHKFYINSLLNKNGKSGRKKSKVGHLFIFCPGLDGIKGG
jgi:hypothetical protein